MKDCGQEFFRVQATREKYENFVRGCPGLIVAGRVDTDYEDRKKRRLLLEIDAGGRATRQVCLRLVCRGHENYLTAATDAGSLALSNTMQMVLTLMGHAEIPVYTAALARDSRLILGASSRSDMLDFREFYKLTIGLAEAAQRISEAFLAASVYPESWCNILEGKTLHYRIGC